MPRNLRWSGVAVDTDLLESKSDGVRCCPPRHAWVCDRHAAVRTPELVREIVSTAIAQMRIPTVSGAMPRTRLRWCEGRCTPVVDGRRPLVSCMVMRWLWSALAALVLIGCGCPPQRQSETSFASIASFGPAIASCVGGQDCRPLCDGLFGLGTSAHTHILHCKIRSLVRDDLSTIPAPIETSMDLQSISGANVAVMYVQRGQHEACTGAADDRSVDDGWSDDDWSDDDWSDDGACDDGSCDQPPGDDTSCDDGSCDDPGDAEPGDEDPGDDGGGDGGGGDGGGGDDGGDRVTGDRGSNRGRVRTVSPWSRSGVAKH